jgi:hydroxymethylbilane synthase
LPQHCTVATGSLRRKSQLLARRHDFLIEPIRGNIDTRIAKLQAGNFGATILALAGVRRANLFDHSMMHPISVDVLIPAPGQGALALQCRRDDATTRGILAQLDDRFTRAAVEAERAVVKAMNCDCHSPIGVYAEFEKENLHIRAALGQKDGQPPLKSAAALAPPEQAVADVVRQLQSHHSL